MIDHLVQYSYIVKKLVTIKPDVLQVIQELDILQRRTELSLVDINKSIASTANSLTNVKSQVTREPLNEHDLFASQMQTFYINANEELQKLRTLYNEADDEYKKMCARFGENPNSVKPTDFFGYIVTFLNCVKASHKHYLDVQAEEKLKKVALDWQNLAVTQLQNKPSKESAPAPERPVPPFQLPPIAPRERQSKEQPPLPNSLPGSHTASGDHRGEKKLSIWAKLKNWGRGL